MKEKTNDLFVVPLHPSWIEALPKVSKAARRYMKSTIFKEVPHE